MHRTYIFLFFCGYSTKFLVAPCDLLINIHQNCATSTGAKVRLYGRPSASNINICRFLTATDLILNASHMHIGMYCKLLRPESSLVGRSFFRIRLWRTIYCNSVSETQLAISVPISPTHSKWWVHLNNMIYFASVVINNIFIIILFMDE